MTIKNETKNTLLIAMAVVTAASLIFAYQSNPPVQKKQSASRMPTITLASKIALDYLYKTKSVPKDQKIAAFQKDLSLAYDQAASKNSTIALNASKASKDCGAQFADYGDYYIGRYLTILQRADPPQINFDFDNGQSLINSDNTFANFVTNQSRADIEAWINSLTPEQQREAAAYLAAGISMYQRAVEDCDKKSNQSSSENVGPWYVPIDRDSYPQDCNSPFGWISENGWLMSGCDDTWGEEW